MKWFDRPPTPAVMGCALLLFSAASMASSDSARIISMQMHNNVAMGESKPGGETKPLAETKPVVVALVNMDEISPDCAQQVAKTRVHAVYYSESGVTPERIRLESPGATFDILTNVGENPVLSLEDIHAARAFIKVGQRYLVHFQHCGDHQPRSLVNMYAEQRAPARASRKRKS